MSFNELMDMIDQPRTGDEMLNVLKTIILADDMSGNEQGALAVGFIIGASFVLAHHNEGHIEQSALGLMQMMALWENTIFKED